MGCPTMLKKNQNIMLPTCSEWYSLCKIIQWDEAMEETKIVFRRSIPLCSGTYLEDISSRTPTVSGEQRSVVSAYVKNSGKYIVSRMV
jgi:hypothetical protein